MGSKVPPMTPKRLGWPTSRIVGAGSAATVEPRSLGLRGAKFGDPLAEPPEVLLVVLRPRFPEPFLRLRGHLRELAPLHEHPVARRPRLRLDDRERQVLVRFVELLVHGFDIDGSPAVGPHPDLLEDLAGLGLPACDVRQEGFHRPALLEVTR